MGNYDSDSSDGGDQDYTETNVLLGYASKEASESDDVNSYIGGRPTWLSPSTRPSATLARCKICADMMILLLQLNGDLPKDFPGHERRLYVLTCRRKTCRRKKGSIRALRSLRASEAAAAKEVQKEEVKPVPKPVAQGQGKVVSDTMFGDSLFGSKSTGGAFGGNPFSSPGGAGVNPFSTAAPAAAANPFSTSELAAKPPRKPETDLPQTFASALSLNAPVPSPPPPAEPWPVDAELPAPYPLFYLADADYETLDKDEPELIQKHQMLEMEVEGPSGGSSGKEDKDVYESSIDTTFQKFADRLSQNPEQVIRYEFRGSPLLYTKSDAVGKLLGGGSGNAKVTVGGGKMPRCANCGAGRCFEVQLTPHAITELESEEVSLEGMEWGTVIVGVCERDCQARGVGAGEVGYLEEWAGVQWEEVPDKMKG
ncbi:hypothetical protein VC83_04697 [Pseudogymnoascus destructans]|uniref:Programmed cell death protein 2 C-terminal domain-containing protein n=2 Tax=Pseudogymnoascus destructans TaxID=655981 RepID=L8FSJ6_PSED2|nr:uncharacterized protein VC83_04697 [Pseudogymnoascus destructans]ELR03847.1 hypothetical protein GMDG_01376 [Pseudogymnoascus destructans 20631-21]OAF57358.1 hypothetical protein VC83_04697 [Pseudogymnoascus destructans]